MVTSPDRTAAARAAFDAQFDTPQAKSEYFKSLAERGAALRKGGVTLSAADAEALHAAFELLRAVAARTPKPVSASTEDGDDVG